MAPPGEMVVTVICYHAKAAKSIAGLFLTGDKFAMQYVERFVQFIQMMFRGTKLENKGKMGYSANTVSGKNRRIVLWI